MEFEQIPDEKVLKEVFNQPSMGIAIFYPNFKYEKVNKAFCDLVSYSEEELKKKSFVDITHPAHILQDTEGVNKIISGENTFYKTEKRYIKKGGEVIWAETFCSGVKNELNQVVFLVSFIFDITKRKYEEDLLKSANALSLERELIIASQKEEIQLLKEKLSKTQSKK